MRPNILDNIINNLTGKYNDLYKLGKEKSNGNMYVRLDWTFYLQDINKFRAHFSGELETLLAKSVEANDHILAIIHTVGKYLFD